MAVNNFIRTISGNSIMSTFGTDHVFAVVSIGPINIFSPSIITQKTFLIHFLPPKRDYPNTLLRLIKIIINNLPMTVKFGI